MLPRVHRYRRGLDRIRVEPGEGQPPSRESRVDVDVPGFLGHGDCGDDGVAGHHRLHPADRPFDQDALGFDVVWVAA